MFSVNTSTGRTWSRTTGIFRINSGLPHPMGNLPITGNQNNIGVLSDGIEPLCSDEFPSGVVCLGDVGDEADVLLKTSGFQLAEEMPAMAIDLQNLTETTLGDEYTFRQVGPDEHDLWVDAFAKGYELRRHLLSGLVRRMQHRLRKKTKSTATILSIMMTAPFPRRWI